MLALRIAQRYFHKKILSFLASQPVVYQWVCFW